MPNSGLSFAFFDHDAQASEIRNFFEAMNSDKMARLTDMVSRLLGTISEYHREVSFRLVICSKEYIRDIHANTKHIVEQLDMTTKQAIINTDDIMTLCYTVSKNNELVDYLPEPLKVKLDDRVTLVFVEFDPSVKHEKLANDDNMSLFLHMINSCIFGIVKLVDNITMLKVASECEDVNESKTGFVAKCVMAHHEYAKSKVRQISMHNFAEELEYKSDDPDFATKSIMQLEVGKMYEYIHDAVSGIDKYEWTDETSTKFAAGVGIAAATAKIEFGSKVYGTTNSKKIRYMEMVTEELDKISATYYSAIDKILSGNYNVLDEADKVKFSEKTIITLLNKLKSMG